MSPGSLGRERRADAGKVFFSVSMSLDGFMALAVEASRVALEPVRATPTQRVTHLTYAVRKR